MKQTRNISPPTVACRRDGSRWLSRWLMLLVAVLWMMPASLTAQGTQRNFVPVISVEGEGQPDATDPNIFTIQCGAYHGEEPVEFCLKLNEAVDYAVSVELRTVSIGSNYSCPISIDDGELVEWEHAVVTFEPGETSKKITFSPDIAVDDLVSFAPIVGKKPFYIELLYPSRATLSTRLIEFVYSFDVIPDADATTNYSVTSIGGNFAVPLYSQDGYAFFFLQPQNDDYEQPFMRITDETSVDFTMPQADFEAMEGEEVPSAISATNGEVCFFPRHQQDTRSNLFTCMHRFNQNECLRQVPAADYTLPFASDRMSEFELMSVPSNAGPFYSPVSTDNGRPITVEGDDITSSGDGTTFQLIHATPYINNVQTEKQQYVVGKQMDVSFEITNWRFYYTFYKETMLQNLFVTFDGGQTRQPLANAIMAGGVVTAAVTAPASAGNYCLEIGVTVSDWTEVAQVATQEYYPATAYTNVSIVAGTAPDVTIQTKAIAGVPDVINYTSEDVHRQYQAYIAVAPVTALCPVGTWSISRKDGQQDDILGIDADGHLTLKQVNGDYGYDFARSGIVTITFTCPDFTLSKEVTLLPVVPAGITFYYDDQQQNVYGLSREVVLDYKVKADASWSLADEGTATMTVTAKDGQQRTIEGIDVSTLHSEYLDDVLHVYVPITLNDHEYSLLERHGKSTQLLWTVKTDISLPFTNSVSQTDYTLHTFRYVNYAYAPVRVDAWAKTASPVYRDVIKGQTDYVVSHAYNLPKDAYFMVHWDIKSDEQWNGQTSYHFTPKRQESWESTQGIGNTPDWLQLLDRGDGYYDAKIIIPIETGDCQGRMMPVVVSTGAFNEPGEGGYGDYGVSCYLHYNVYGKDDLHVYVQRRYSQTDNDVLELADGETLELNDQAGINAFNSFMASYQHGDDIFGQIASLRKANILAISPQYTGGSYGGTWEARKTKIKVTGGLLGQKELTVTSGDGQFIYFPMADATYTIEISNETFQSVRTITYATHALPHADDIYAFKSHSGYYKVGEGTAQTGYSMSDQISLSYFTKNGVQGYVPDSRHGRNNTWFYESDDIVSYNAIDLNGRLNFGSMGFVRGFREPYDKPQFTAGDVGASAGGAVPSFSQWSSLILSSLENDDEILAGTNFDNDGQLHITLHNLMGEPVGCAHVNYVAVGADGQPSGKGGGRVDATADGKVTLPFQSIIEDVTNESLYLEVVATGYEPRFYKFNQLEESYRNGFNTVPSNEVDLMLETADEATTLFSRADLMSIVEANADTTAVTFGITDMTAFNLVDKVSYKEDGPLGGTKAIYTLTADKGTYKYTKRWEGEKFVQLGLTFLRKSSALDYSQMRLTGYGNKKDATPMQVTTIAKDVYTGFEHDYIDATFDLVGFVPNEKMAIPVLKLGEADLAQLPKLHNDELDIDSVARNTKISIMTNPDFNPADIGTESAKRDCELGGDNQELFNQIDFDFPEVMGFQFQVKKVGNHFQVRGVYSKNILPGGDEADMVDSFAEEMMGYANQFDKVFKDCVDACTGGSGGDEDFDFLYGNDPLFASNDAFVGIRAFISGVAYLGPKGEFMMNFHEGGIKLEMSGEYTHKCSFGIGSFGAKLSGELSTQLKLINHKAAAGDVYNFSLNVMVETEVRAEIVAWATAGLNILNLVKAEVGVRGGVSASYKSGISYPLYGNAGTNSVYAGHKLSLRSGMFIYADARFLWWKKHWEKWLFKYSKDFCWPDDASNPYSGSFAYGEPIFSSRAMGGRSWKKVKARRVVGLGQTLMNDVTGMASPRLFNHGTSIVYNKLNSPNDYNDDRLMMRTIGGGADLDINPDATGSAFAFDVAERGDRGVAAFEQYRTDDLSRTDVEGSASVDDMNLMSSNVDVVASLWNGTSWHNTIVSLPQSGESEGTANLSPRVAVQADGHAAVVWLSGTPMATESEVDEDRQQYIEGSYLLSRYDGTEWSQPVELARLSRSFIVSDHHMVMHGDSLLIIMEHQDDIASKDNPYIDFITVTPKNAVSTFMGVERGRNPQVVRMGDVNMVGYLTQRPDSTQDIRLRTVDMGNNSVATTDAYARLGKRSIGTFKLTATENAASLDDLALIWNQSVIHPESGETASWLCAGRFGKSGQQLFVSYPEQVVQIPDDFTASAFDGYIDDNNLHVVYALSDIDNDGTAVMQNDVTFTNDIRIRDCVVSVANATSAGNIPFRLSVQNTGYAPVTAITAEIGTTTVAFNDMNLLPGETADLSGHFAIDTDSYTGEEQMTVTAQFGGLNNALSRRRAPERSASNPAMTATRTTDCDVKATDLSCTIVANRIKGTTNSVIVKVTNCSPLPLLSGQTVTAGIYSSLTDDEPISGTQLTTIPVSDLYADSHPLSKVIRLQATDLPENLQAFIKVVVSDSEQTVADVNPENNHVPVTLYSEDGSIVTLPGDANGDGEVNIADVTAVINHINGQQAATFVHAAADVNDDGDINIADVTGIINIINK